MSRVRLREGALPPETCELVGCKPRPVGRTPCVAPVGFCWPPLGAGVPGGPGNGAPLGSTLVPTLGVPLDPRPMLGLDCGVENTTLGPQRAVSAPLPHAQTSTAPLGVPWVGRGKLVRSHRWAGCGRGRGRPPGGWGFFPLLSYSLIFSCQTLPPLVTQPLSSAYSVLSAVPASESVKLSLLSAPSRGLKQFAGKTKAHVQGDSGETQELGRSRDSQPCPAQAGHVPHVSRASGAGEGLIVTCMAGSQSGHCNPQGTVAMSGTRLLVTAGWGLLAFVGGNQRCC